MAGRLLPAAPPAPRSRRHGVPEAADRGREETDAARSDALRSRLRLPRSPDPGNAGGGHLPRDPARPRRRLQGRTGDARQLRAAVQADPQSETARRPAAAADAVSAAAVQPDRRSAQRQGVTGRGVLRLPCQRPHELGDAYRRRHPAQRAPSPHRHAVAARRRHSAPVRIAARPEDASRTSPSSSSARRTSTATTRARRARA